MLRAARLTFFLPTSRFHNLAQYFMKRYPELNIEVEKELIRYRVRNIFVHSSLHILEFKVHTRAVPVVISNGLRATPTRR